MKPFRKTTYRGYSTVGRKSGTSLFDVSLVKQDLLNHFNTKKNERYRNANYGSLIPDLLFEFNTSDTTDKIVQETIRIIGTDGRVQLVDYATNKTDYGFQMDCVLYYIGLDVQEIFKLTFDATNALVTPLENTDE